jgi:hypothetical protein
MDYPTEWTNIIFNKSNEIKNRLPLIPKNTDKVAVLIDSRNDMFLLHVFRIFIFHLAPKGFMFCFYHTESNEQFAKTFIEPLGVKLIKLNAHLRSFDDYNSLLTSDQFWERMPAEHVLLFQMDTYIRNGDIEPFLQYDYIGAPWHPVICNWLKHENRVGNGGLSLRKRSAMIRCLQQVSKNTLENEDRFFCQKCEHLLNLPSTDVARSFSVETWEHPTPFGFHKPWQIVNRKHDYYVSKDYLYSVMKT